LGFFVDIYIEYLVRVMLRFIRACTVGAWPTVSAKIKSVGYRPGGFGCAVADLTYEYSFKSELYTGANANPFVMTASAKDYIKHYSEGGSVIVRVDPTRPHLSVMLERDQWSLPQRRNP